MEKTVDELLNGFVHFLDKEVRLNTKYKGNRHIGLKARDLIVWTQGLQREFRRTYKKSPKVKISNFLGHMKITPE